MFNYLLSLDVRFDISGEPFAQFLWKQ